MAEQAAEPQLGTLFYSPKEREALEQLRRGDPTEVKQGSGSAMRADPVVTGYVKRSDGKSTVFLDKQPYPARDGRMQGLLEPRIVERYEPIPLPPEPPAPATVENGEGAGRPAAQNKAQAAPTKGGKAE